MPAISLRTGYIEQVVGIRKQLGEDHPDYTKAKQLLEDYKRQRLVVDTAAGRIGRLWKRLRHKDGAPGAVSLPSVRPPEIMLTALVTLCDAGPLVGPQDEQHVTVQPIQTS